MRAEKLEVGIKTKLVTDSRGVRVRGTTITRKIEIAGSTGHPITGSTASRAISRTARDLGIAQMEEMSVR